MVPTCILSNKIIHCNTIVFPTLSNLLTSYYLLLQSIIRCYWDVLYSNDLGHYLVGFEKLFCG